MRNPLLRSTLWLFLLGLPITAVTVSCSKAKEEPQPTTGSIEGTVSPAGAVTSVTATNAGGLAFPATPNATTGAFSLPNLAPGTYALSFTPAKGYAAPVSRSASVSAGQTTAAGTIAVLGDGTPRGTVTWTVGGTAYSATVLSGLITTQGFSLEAAAATPTFTDYITLDLPAGITATGTYPLVGSGPLGNLASYRRTTGPVTVAYTTRLQQTSSTTGISGRGSLVVSSYDAANRTMSGTFAFDAYNTDTGISNPTWASITGGTFTLRY